MRTVSDLSAAKIEEQRGTENPSHEHQSRYGEPGPVYF